MPSNAKCSAGTTGGGRAGSMPDGIAARTRSWPPRRGRPMSAPTAPRAERFPESPHALDLLRRFADEVFVANDEITVAEAARILLREPQRPTDGSRACGRIEAARRGRAVDLRRATRDGTRITNELDEARGAEEREPRRIRSLSALLDPRSRGARGCSHGAVGRRRREEWRERLRHADFEEPRANRTGIVRTRRPGLVFRRCVRA